jgi:hypothetical protein
MKTSIYCVSYLARFKTKNVSDESFRENNKEKSLCYFFSQKFCRYEKMWGKKNFVERGRLQMTIWRMRIACWIPKATNTPTGCVTLIAFPQQQWLYERASLLRYTYIACLVLK